jgi:hypothetical protein
MSWSSDGKVVLIKNQRRINDKIIPYFEGCHTSQQFISMVSVQKAKSKLSEIGWVFPLQLRSCKFIRVVKWKRYGTQYAFKHNYYDRDTTPQFDFFEDEHSHKSAFEMALCDENEKNIQSDHVVEKKLKQSRTQVKGFCCCLLI